MSVSVCRLKSDKNSKSQTRFALVLRFPRAVEEVKKATVGWIANPGPMIIDVRVSRSVVTQPYAGFIGEFMLLPPKLG